MSEREAIAALAWAIKNPNAHECAAPGCHVALPNYLLACRAHWRQLPPFLQVAITKAWNRRRRHPENADLAAAHIAVVQDAVAIWVGVPVAVTA